MSAALPAVDAVARAFAAALAREIGPGCLAEVIALNRAESSAGVCHSHDFCDANMVMATALEGFGVDPLPEDADGMADDVLALWNAAWSAAKSAAFFADEVAA